MDIITTDLQTLNGDLIFVDGDFSIFNSSRENANAILDANKGEWKQYPELGCDISSYLNSPVNTNNIYIQNLVKIQLSNDGFDTTDFLFTFDLSTNIINLGINGNRVR